ncbi:MAG TPA: FAD-dependent oxidoreductase, partial [Candidatus Eisenbacteria bacterium]|nr:FAD-dependent oxidoreductase [Candidatus Eisenbacteria bacterium]
MSPTPPNLQDTAPNSQNTPPSHRPRVAVVGAGPIGLEAALEAASRGCEVSVYDAGRIGEHLLRFGWVTLFTPFAMNSSERGRARLSAADVALPAADALLTAGEFVAHYLEPLARLPELSAGLHERTRVAAIGREGLFKSDAVMAAGDRARVGRPFLLRVEPDGAPARFDRADVVIDASGVYGSPRATGPSGLPALGEESLGDRIDRHLVPLAAEGGAGPRYAGRRVLLVGDGYSAATALVELDALARRGEPARVTWVRTGDGREPFRAAPDDPLPERAALAASANRIARE